MGITDLEAMKKIFINPCTEMFPAVLKPYLAQAKLYDSSCSEAARTIYIEGDVRAYLKIDAQGKLLREKEMTCFMHRHGLAPQILEYLSSDGKDYLLTAALYGEDGISDKLLAFPLRLAAVMGEYLRLIHALPVEGCPYPNRTAEMISESEANILRGYADTEIITKEIPLAATRLAQLKTKGVDDVVIHGDYCLPNIIMQDFKLQGFVDLGTGGVGDRHYDLFWGIWTLNYNLKTDKYRDVFLDAYGRQEFDAERLELSRLLAGFTV